MTNFDLLLTPYQLTDNLQLKNRIIMAPMTRNMAHDDLSPTQDMLNYYARRADAGLIITEGTIIRPDGKGYSNTPGIYTANQINAWRKITDAVHARNGKIFLQIWHVGRVSHPYFLNGELPISASATTMTGKVRRTSGAGELTYGQARAVTIDEIKGLIESYANAAKNAIDAGFDGAEIHGANGYLIDEFLHYDTNHREDAYGQTPENMARFALEIVRACGDAIGYQRVGLRLSPGAYLNEITGDKRDAAVFQYLLKQLNNDAIAYVHTGNFNDKTQFAELENRTMTSFMRKHYQGKLIACGGYNFDEAQQGLLANDFDLIAIGRPFIANFDLIKRLSNREEMQAYDPSMLTTLY